MRLFIETMDAVLTDFSATGQVRFHGEDWSTPNLQESRCTNTKAWALQRKPLWQYRSRLEMIA